LTVSCSSEPSGGRGLLAAMRAAPPRQPGSSGGIGSRRTAPRKKTIDQSSINVVGVGW